MNNATFIIPKSVENLNLPDPELANFFSNLEQRIFWIDSEIDNYLLEIIKYIIQWNQEDNKKEAEDPFYKREPIKIFFFSPGGDLDINYAVIDAIRLSKTPVIGINVGQCASAAAYIYLSCHKRYMMPHSYFIFHQGSGTLSGTYGEICAQMDDYHQQIAELANFMVQHTNYSVEEVTEKLIGEWYIRGEEAIEKGVAHKILDDLLL